MYHLGFDIGGSSIKAVLVKEKQIIESLVEDAPGDLDGLLGLVEKMKNGLTEGIAVDQIGGVDG